VALLMTIGCSEARDYAFLDEDDLRLVLPEGTPSTDAPVRAVAEDSARDLDRALAEPTAVLVDVVEFVRRRRETERRGDWRVFGPFDDPSGRDLSWRVELLGGSERSRFSIDVGAGVGSEPSLRVVEGAVQLDGDRRFGDVAFDVGGLSMMPGLGDPKETFAGRAEIEFDHDGDIRTLSMWLDGFASTRLGESSWTSTGPLTYERSPDGGGEVSVDVVRSSDDPLAAGTAVRRFDVSIKWRADARRLAKAIAHPEQPEDTPAPALGELIVDECFEADGRLVYADVSEPYRELLADYVRGDRQQCAFSDAELGRN
jgi:hypothetical protein